MMALLSARGYLRSLSSGSVINTIYMPAVKSFQVCLPTHEKQLEISKRYSTTKLDADSLLQSIQHELETIEAMPSAILRKAFSGEL
jgi:restriction endonuclease S subunit